MVDWLVDWLIAWSEIWLARCERSSRTVRRFWTISLWPRWSKPWRTWFNLSGIYYAQFMVWLNGTSYFFHLSFDLNYKNNIKKSNFLKTNCCRDLSPSLSKVTREVEKRVEDLTHQVLFQFIQCIKNSPYKSGKFLKIEGWINNMKLWPYKVNKSAFWSNLTSSGIIAFLIFHFRYFH